MPRIVVVGGQTTYMDEEVLTAHLNDEHSAYQVLERLTWALIDAERDEQPEVRGAVDYRQISAA